jgi:hypothetical protein
LKKISNAADHSTVGKSRCLQLPINDGSNGWRLYKVNLGLGKLAWQLVEPGWGSNTLRRWRRLSVHVFEKDRYTKMKVGLAAKGFSGAMMEVIQENRKQKLDPTGELDGYYKCCEVINPAWVRGSFYDFHYRMTPLTVVCKCNTSRPAFVCSQRKQC